MRNSFRPYRLASLRYKGEARTSARAGEAGGAEGLGDKAAIGAGRWLETEGSEGRLREAACSPASQSGEQESQHS